MGNMVKVMKLLNRAVTDGKLPKYCLENLQAVENPIVRENLMTYVSKFANKTGFKAQRMKAHADDFTYKLKMCDDIAVKQSAEKLLENGIKRSNIFHLPPRNLTTAELLLDSVNSAESKYSVLTDNVDGKLRNFSSFFSYFKTLRKAQVFVGKDKLLRAEKWFLKTEKAYSEPHKFFTYCARHKLNFSAEEIKFEQRYSSLKKYIEEFPEDKDGATYLWTKYFLSKQDKITQNILSDIYNEYGVRVCFNQKVARHELLYLREELAQYKKALGDKLKTPALFDIRKDYCLTKEFEYAGYTNCKSKIIITPESLVTDQREGRYLAIRHELAHMQDSKVSKHNHRKIHSRADVSELEAGGIIKGQVNYYFKNKAEAKAVFAECDMNAVSDAFKRKMTEEIKGLPKEIVNLQDVSRPKVALLSKFYGKKNEKIIEELEKLLGGKISDEVAVAILDEPNYFWVVEKILKKQPKGSLMSEKEFLIAFKGLFGQYNQGFYDNNSLEYARFLLKHRRKYSSVDEVTLAQFIHEGNYKVLKNFKQALADSSNAEEIKKVEIGGIFS